MFTLSFLPLSLTLANYVAKVVNLKPFSAIKETKGVG